MIAVVGDIHGEFIRLKEIDNRLSDKIDAIIQVGDFGYHPTILSYWQTMKIPVYFIDGNHEHFDALRPFMKEKGPVEVLPNLFYVPRGTIMEMDGKKIGFAGGAASVDKKWRAEGVDWWPDEILTEGDIEPLMHPNVQLDVIITHAPPKKITDKHFNKNTLKMFDLPVDWVDPSQIVLDKLHERHPNTPIICGHMHRRVDDRDEQVRILDVGEIIAL